jgi:hypothetical protein
MKPTARRSSELIARWTMPKSNILTVQNWYPGNKEGKGGVFTF